MKFFEMRLQVVESKKGERIEKKYDTGLRVSDETNFSDIVDFLDDIKNIWKRAMGAVKRGNWMEMEVVVSTYDNWNTDEPLKQKSYDRWVSAPVEAQDQEGIYLSADTRYTRQERDMYLTKDTIRDLAFTLR